ncbi:roadblock/LC7 domain-containing protein [Geopsychrobacter electrodiphilus]|uniref:roadblock/LC7 domain-containing protein n=1 Tax=Geopsychrobacter electrodiphilus TaxID=225196 RepID=UPI00037695D9|nr:roadblock/LC7 domain-containing protein [Geopsychrobacter electrodiphilus]
MPFKILLQEMLDRLPGAQGAIIADWEGEAVDQVARIDDFEIKVLGAHKGIILTRLRETLHRLDGGELEEVLIQYENAKVLIVPLNEDYFLVLTIDPDEMVGKAAFELRRCAVRLRLEIS